MSFAGEAEQRQFGRNGVDVIDEFCEASVFDDAARYLTKASLKLSNDQKLTFYALFKQATVGPCNTSKPSILSMYERTKWNAWNDMGKLSKDAAIVRYVAELEKVSPSWREQAGIDGSVSDSEEEGSRGSNGGTDGVMVMPQSRPVVESEVAEADLTDAQKDVHFYAKQNNFKQIQTKVAKGADINAKDEEGRTPLHWAVDRAHESLVHDLIVQLRADVNAQDGDGSTALHYAAMCDNLPLTLYLLQHGANAQLADESGETAATAIRAMQRVTPAILQLLDAPKSKSD